MKNKKKPEKTKQKIKQENKKIESFKKELKKIIDPEVGISIVDMGLVKNVKKKDNNKVEVIFSPTTPFCPIVNFFVMEIKKKAEKFGLECEVKVE